jgi:hypothetical protein
VSANYVMLYADLSSLSPDELDAFVATAAEVGVDVDQIYPRMGADPEAIVLMSTTLAALLSKLLDSCGEKAGKKLWELLQQLLRRSNSNRAIEDSGKRISFIFDKRAEQDGALAAEAMVAIGDAVNAIPDGTTLFWNPETLQWEAPRGK